MRIRKRFPPPPPSLSSSSPASAALLLSSSSDPQLNRPPVLPPPIKPNSHGENHLSVVQNNNPTKSDDPTPTPNREMMIGSANPRWGFLTSIQKERKIEDEPDQGEGWKEEQEEKKSSNDTRKESNIGAELNTSTMHLSQTSSSSSSKVVGLRWGDQGDKNILPLKKRKGSFESVIDIIARKEASSSDMKEKMKSKTNKKCLFENGHQGKEGIKETDDDDDHDDDHEEENIKDDNYSIHGKINNGGSSSMKIKSKRGSVIMEGSRCSRVNGRGWRCCQQTLVGYSLCEHHLGKGRLRSITSVRNRGGTASRAPNHPRIGARDYHHDHDHDQIAPPRFALQENQEISKDIVDDIDDDDDDDDETRKKKKKTLVKKRMKLGVVKARSISSLLGQTNVENMNRVVAAANGGDHSHGSHEDEYYH